MRIVLTTLILAGMSSTASFGGDAKADKTLYQTSCKGCHAPDGAGNPAVAKMMNVEMKRSQVAGRPGNERRRNKQDHHGRERKDASS